MSIGQLKQAKQTSILLAAMDAADCRALFETSHRKHFPNGSTIFQEGEPGSTVILIETGRAEISITSLSGRKSVLAHMGPGEVLGEIAALDGGPRSATATAASDISGRVLSRQNILQFVSDRPNVSSAIIAELCRKVRNATDMYSVQTVTEGGQRLARALLRLFDKWGEPHGGETRLTEKFSQADIGEFSGLARENVNRHVKAWAEQGILRIDGRQLTLLDRSALLEMAEL
ncbi:MAG: Crp/Fnr family transcriptional regulator [Pseudomonadota bacterium]